MAPMPGGSDYLPGMPYDHSSLRMCDCSSERVLAALCGTLRCAHRRPRRAVLPPHRARPAADHRTLHLPPAAGRSLCAAVCSHRSVHAHSWACTRARARACACARACVPAHRRECAHVRACASQRLGCVRASVTACASAQVCLRVYHVANTRPGGIGRLGCTSQRRGRCSCAERSGRRCRRAQQLIEHCASGTRKVKPHPQLTNLSLALDALRGASAPMASLAIV